MRYVRFLRSNGEIKYGILHKDNSIQVLLGTPFEKRVLTEEITSLEKVTLLSPVEFSKAVCIGLNYRDHAEEFKKPIPKSPVIFIKPSTSANRPNGPIYYPEMSHRLDYEAELAVVIGERCHKVEEKDALDYVLGYTNANDVTARDLQPVDGQWTLSKCFDGFLPLGPYISDEVDPDNLKIESRVNGVKKQESNTSNLIFKVSYLISYISKAMTLLPGDVISTGTPDGISGMQIGDEVEIEIEGLGILKNKIEKEKR